MCALALALGLTSFHCRRVACSLRCGSVQHNIQCLVMSEMKEEIRKFLKRIAIFFFGDWCCCYFCRCCYSSNIGLFCKVDVSETMHSWAISYNVMHFSKCDTVLIHPNRHHYNTHTHTHTLP